MPSDGPDRGRGAGAPGRSRNCLTPLCAPSIPRSMRPRFRTERAVTNAVLEAIRTRRRVVWALIEVPVDRALVEEMLKAVR
jgi:hypothetical protein